MSKRFRIHWCWPEALRDDPRLRERLEVAGELSVSADLPSVGAPVDVLVPRLEHEVDAAVIRGIPSLRVIGTPSTGTDHIDVREATRQGIAVVSLKDERAFLDSLQSTAELAWLLLLGCARRLREATAQTTAGQWDAMSVRGHELIGRTLGIIGGGRLGTMVARFGAAFQMRVLVSDIRPVEIAGAEQVPMDQLLAQSDFVSLHVHLNDQTHGLIGGVELRKMKQGAILINTSRGAVVDETALLAAIQSGHLAAAGLDVLEGERQIGERSHPLVEAAKTDPRILITPHVGGCTVEAQRKAFDFFVGRLIEGCQTVEKGEPCRV